MKQKGFSKNQIILYLEKKGYPYSQIYDALYPRSNFNLKQQYQAAPQPKSSQPVTKENNLLVWVIGIIIVFLIIAIITIFYSPLDLISEDDVFFISEADLDFQDKVKTLTGYDWIGFLDADDSENAKIAALLFLSNEINSLEDDFKFVKRSVGMEKSELPKKLDATDNSKDNLLKYIDNLKSAETIFLEKGLISSQTRIHRLQVIQNYFKKNSLPEGGLNEDLSEMFAESLGLKVDEYSRLVSLIIVNYSLFLVE